MSDARSSWIGRAGEAAAWVISALAWAVSFAAQVSLARAHGFTLWEALAWGMTTDIAGLVGMLLALDQVRRNASARGPWVIALASAGVMVAANVGSAFGDVVAMLMHAWPPFIALASWYVLVHVRRSPPKPSVTTTQTTVTAPLPETVTPPKRRVTLRAQDTVRLCEGCGEPLDVTAGSLQKFHSDACKQRAYRNRQNGRHAERNGSTPALTGGAEAVNA